MVGLVGLAGVVDAVLQHAASRAGARAYTFLDDGETESAVLTYGDLAARSRGMAGQLLAHGVARGEPVLLAFPAGLEFITAFLGCLRAGAVAVPLPLPRRHRDHEPFLRIAADTGARVVLTTAAHRARLAAAISVPGLAWLDAGGDAPGAAPPDLPLPAADDLALIQYTSGSTGDPKGVMITHGNLAHNEACIQEAMGHGPDLVGVGWLPHVHDMGLVGNFLQTLVAGGHLVLMPPGVMVQSPSTWLRAISTYGGTTCGGPNFAFDLCVEKVTPRQRAALDLRSWRVAFVGAEPVRPATLARFADAFAPCGFDPEAWLPCYGMAETTLMVTGARGLRTLDVDASSLTKGRWHPRAPGDDTNDGAGDCAKRVVSCGPPGRDTVVAIRDTATGGPAAPDVVGEILVAGPSVGRGYWRRPDVTDERFDVTLPSHDRRFLATGDLGVLHDGELYVLGRLKEMVIVRGQNYYAEDLERTAQEAHEALQNGGTAVFGIQSAEAEDVVVVQEVRRAALDGLDAAGAAGAIAQAIWAEHEVAVTEVLLVPPGQVRRTTSGKVQRAVNRTTYEEDAYKTLLRLRPAGAVPAGADGPDALTRQALLETGAGTREARVFDCLAALVARLSGDPSRRLEPRDNLMELGLDSMHLLEVKRKLDELAGGEIPLSAFLDTSSVAALARLVVEQAVPGEPPAAGCPFHQMEATSGAAATTVDATSRAPGPDAVTLEAELSRMSHSFPDYLVELTATHGDLVRLDLGEQVIHLVANPDELDTVLISGHDRWLRRAVWAPFRGVMGHQGLITSEGDEWRRERRFANPLFGRPATQQDVPAIARVAARAVAAWADTGAPVPLLPAAKRLTLEIILDKLFGAAPERAEADALYDVLYDIDRLWNVPAFFLYANRAGERQVRAYQERLARRVEVIDRCVYAWVDRLLDARPDAGPDTGPDGGGVVGAYARAAVESAGTGRVADEARRELRDVAVTYILTGFDTTASGIYWTVAMLLDHPAAFTRVAEETVDVPDVQLAGLPYLRAAVQEALRLYPPVWYVGREATADTTLRGYAIPEGSFAIASPYVVHRNPAHWPEPSAFRPERFLPGATPKPPVRAYLPFGLGGRICIGMHFALAEIATVVGALARDYRLERVGGDWRGLSSDFTLTPRDPIQIAVSRAIALT